MIESDMPELILATQGGTDTTQGKVNILSVELVVPLDSTYTFSLTAIPTDCKLTSVVLISKTLLLYQIPPMLLR
jgi:hypothetical protein